MKLTRQNIHTEILSRLHGMVGLGAALIFLLSALPGFSAVVLYTYSDGDLQQYASEQDVADANGSSIGSVASGYTAVANAGSQWVLWNTATASLRSYGSYSDFLGDSNSSDYDLSAVGTGKWEGIGSDGTQWVLYDGTNDGDGKSEFRVFPLFANLLSNTGFATYQPSNYAFEDIDSDGTAWYMYDEGSGDVLRYTALADMTSNNLTERVRTTGSAATTGFEGFAVQVVPEPDTVALIAMGFFMLLFRRFLRRSGN